MGNYINSKSNKPIPSQVQKKLFENLVRPNEKRVLVFKFKNMPGIAYKLYHLEKYHYIYINDIPLEIANKLEYPYNSLKERCSKMTIPKFSKVTIIICDIEKKDNIIQKLKNYVKKPSTKEKIIEFKIPDYDNVSLMDYDSFETSYKNAIAKQNNNSDPLRDKSISLEKSISIKNPLSDDLQSHISLHINKSIPQLGMLDIASNLSIKSTNTPINTPVVSLDTSSITIEESPKLSIFPNKKEEVSMVSPITKNLPIDISAVITSDLPNELAMFQDEVKSLHRKTIKINNKYLGLIVDPVNIVREKFRDLDIELELNVSGEDLEKIKKAISILEYQIDTLKKLEEL